ncbi:hypothetical protein AQS8620_00211 [Aquimixticola soesokkakensis]|uniref:Endonuclease/exonuclease/phosphatase domain-containing protein n=1 Tax=Aquimixticola soesokkakensis TaxID=1519096 RepID=A0A1Y5RCG5_9RHOB|nr:endonuclease/exonuclease/phosphatase family protein [Aquimixticola soesokkakensis]SLN14077.1 hypothetical protein AQS8620_00211 [Aquimixticola soesokkakensis]
MALWTVELTRRGPGLLLNDILKDDDDQIAAVAAVIAHVDPDVLLLTGIDFDTDLFALQALAARIAREGPSYPHLFARRPNTGVASGRDLDHDGRAGEPQDALAYGRFAGQGGMALLSKLPIRDGQARDFTALLWRDVPEADLPAGFYDAGDLDILALSSGGHWDVPLDWNGTPLHILAYAATTPVFDGPEDRNGKRNADETRFWMHYLDSRFDSAPPQNFILMGDSNLDPFDGEGQRGVMRALLDDPRLQDPEPRSRGAHRAANPDQHGDPALDTANWNEPTPGNLRVDYILPAAQFSVTDAGVFWPPPEDPLRALIGADGTRASRHALVWVDLAPLP